MIYFNEETRSFGIFNGPKLKRQFLGVSNKKVGIGAGLANVAMNKVKRNNLEKQYIAQGKDPAVAKAMAKKQTSGMVGSFVKGAVVGAVGKGLMNKLVK